MKIIIYLMVVGFGIFWFKWKINEVNKTYRPYINKVKGNIGENVVVNILDKLDDRYEVYHDVRVGKAQIDHMVIYRNIRFVIETKFWKGKVIGKRLDDKWKQLLGGREYWYKNPINQNEFHIKELVKSGKCSGCEFVNVVVFVGSDSIPRLKGVMRDSELFDYIVEYESKAS